MTAPKRLDSLTSLRAVAAFVVFGVHFNYMSFPGTPHAFKVAFDQGGVGVSFFFILSGFVLCWASGADLPKRTFWRRRIARIYPAYLVAWLLGVALALFASFPLHLGSAIASLVLLQTWAPHLDYWFAVNGVGWTLCCEAFFYALYPFLAQRLIPFGQRTRNVLMAACPVVTLAIGLASGPGQRLEWVSHFLPLSRLPEFVLGMLLAVAVRRDEIRPLPLLPTCVLALVAYLLAGVAKTPDLSVAIPMTPLALLIVGSAQRDIDGTSRLVRPWMVWLGSVSYSFYLIHELVRDFAREVARRVLGHPWVIHGTGLNVVYLVVMLMLSLAAAAALHYLVEQPAERRLRDDRRPSVGDSTNQVVSCRVEG